jgi:hypothetical protein
MPTRLEDIYEPLTFGRRAQEAQTRLNRFLSSGIAVLDGDIATQIAAGGSQGEVSGFRALTQDEPNYSNDNPAESSTPDKIDSLLQRFRSASRNKSWSNMDLARELALIDPVAAITGSIGSYWATDDEQRLINTLIGVMESNITNDDGDMVVDVSNDDASAVTDDERIGGERVIDGLQTLGDHKSKITTLAIHSNIHARLMKQGLIQTIRDADNNVLFESYMSKRLIIDDSLPAVAGTNRIKYTCIMFGGAVVGYAPGKVLVPSEMKRDPEKGNGGGQETIWSRVNNVWHPYGFDFTSTTVTGKFPTYANLKLAANWARKWQRKNIPMAFIRVND